jgi:hypothetical protein
MARPAAVLVAADLGADDAPGVAPKSRPGGGATVAIHARIGGHDASPMVQFAAATSREAANSFWRGLVHRFPDALGQREPVVIRFEHDGTEFWRVRAVGFDTLAEALTLCAQMRAGGQDCFVTRS